jgi:hypothetical protein
MRRTLLLVIAFIALSDLYAQTRLGLHFTKEELEIWKKRAVSGPYRTKGDVQPNSPGDWNRVVSEADAFLANPSTERWVGYTGGGCFPTGSTYEPKVKGVFMQSAAFVWLVTGNNKYLAPIKEELLWHAKQPLLDFTNTSRWCYIGDSNPGFNISEWLTKCMHSYDYIKETLTPAERAILDNWLLGAAKYYVMNVDAYFKKRFADRANGNYQLSSYSIACEKDNYKQTMYYGSTPVGFLARGYNNRHGTNVRFIGTVGIFLDNQELQDFAKRWFFEWMRYGVYPSMDIADLHRCLVNPSTEPERGYNYVYSFAQAMSDLADVFARSGDNSLYEYATTDGYYGSESPGNPKTLQKVLENTLKYMNGTHKRYASEVSTTNSNMLINGIDPYASPGEIAYDTWFCVANRYYKNKTITANYLRQAPGCRPYPNTARNIGGFHTWGGHAGIYPATLFMFGQLEGVTDPYTNGSTTLPDKPVVVITGSTNLCQGSSVVLSAPANYAGYKWSSGENTRQITVSAAGSYKLKVKDQNDNFSPDSDEVIVKVTTVPQPVITPLGSTSICSGESVSLSAGSGEGLTYQWKRNDEVITNATDASYTATQAGNYTVLASKNNCVSAPSASVTVSITNVPKPIITAAGNTTFNEGESVVLSTNQGTEFSYQWRLNGELISNADNYSFTATKAGNYSVRIKQNNCESEESALVSVTVNSSVQSVAIPDGNVNFCEGGSVLLKSVTGTGLSYEWFNNEIKIPNAQASSYSATASGKYTVVVSKDGIPLLPSNPITVTVTPLIIAEITANGPTAFCSNGAVNLEANKGPGLTYRWKKDGNVIPDATSSEYKTNRSGSYSVDITQNGCQTISSNVIDVVVNKTTTPVIVVDGSTNFCEGDSAVLSTTNEENVVYQWKRNGVVIADANKAEYTAKQAGSYTVEATRNNCSLISSEPVSITVNTTFVPVISATDGTVLCDVTTLLLKANVGSGITYQWQKDGINIPKAVDANLEVIQPGVYTVLVTRNGCGSVLSNALTVTNSTVPVPEAVITAQGSTNICAGTSVTLSANTGAGLSYQWHKNGDAIANATNPTYAADASGQYSVEITREGCRTRVSNEITVSVASLATKPAITASGNTTIFEGGNVTLSTTPVTGLLYQWLRNSINIAGATSPTYKATLGGRYTLAVTQNNCQQAISDPIVVSVKTTTINVPVIIVTGPTTFCDGGSVKLTAPAGYTEYQWSNGATTQSITVTTTGEYSVTISQGKSTSTYTSKPIKIDVIPQPSQPEIKRENEKLLSSPGYVYQWFLNEQVISGATEREYTPTQDGSYTVIITNERGCATLSKPMHYTIGNSAAKVAVKGTDPIVYPNPTTGTFILAFPVEASTENTESHLEVSVANAFGQIVYQEETALRSDNSVSLDVSFLHTGVYLLKVKQGGKVYNKKIMKE